MNESMSESNSASLVKQSASIHVVLNRPIYPRNVGMCARAIANMGVDNLVIIAPRANLSSEDAKQGAANAQKVLSSARVYASLDQFYAEEGEGIRIALSGRIGGTLQAARLDDHLESVTQDKPLYLFFGPEDDGLANEETRLCHYVCRLPTFGSITSLNLSHAVLLTLYMVQAKRGVGEAEEGASETLPAPAYYPTDSIRRWLEALGFDLSAPKVSIEKTLNRIFLGNIPSSEDLRILDSVLHQTVRKLRRTDKL
jgi:TrmH family RNA methyltransferase